MLRELDRRPLETFEVDLAETARGGGQPGDTGVLRWDGGEVRVLDTVKRGGRLLHEVDGEPPPAGTAVTAEIDWGRALLDGANVLEGEDRVHFRLSYSF